jgi:mono/diheme cytochrome c family protein
VILVAGAGSLGGDLVHGEGHITDALWRAIDVTERSQRASAEAEARATLGAPPRESVPSPAAPAIAAQPSVAPAAELARHVASIDYATQVRPLLEAHCYECHGNGKKKGGVRLDDLERLTAERGGEWVVKPGDPQSSLLIKFVSLPEDDEDRMPPEGDSLTDDEVSLLRDWIREGARTESMLPSSPASAQSHAVVPLADSGWSAPERVLNVDEQSRVAAVASALVPRGVSVRPLAEACGFLEVDMSRAEPKADSATVELLMSVADLAISFNASRSDLDDASAGSLARLSALREVRLDFTRAGDSTAATLAALPHLHTANFVGTPLSDAGLALLAQSPSLRRVYVWSSAVTQDGIDAATRVNARLRVVTSK